MTYIMVDIETDGPAPADYSMVWLGAVVVEPGLQRRFSAQIRPVSEKYIPEALAVSHLTREMTLDFEDAATAMRRFAEWIAYVTPKRPMFVSDNNGFDFAFVNYYFHHFLGENPFGHSSTNLGSLYKGLVRDMTQNFKHLRQTAHTHDPVDDAVGNAEAMLAMLLQIKHPKAWPGASTP